MNVTIRPAPVRRSVVVEAPRDRAFQTFTAGFARWWPKSHSIGASPLQTAVIEPHTGGRWYEVGEDGAECDWGEVLAWEPPSRLLLAWRIGADWRHDPELLTEVEILFEPLSESTTRVSLEHRKLENMGAAAETGRAILDSEGGWPGILRMFADAAAQS